MKCKKKYIDEEIEIIGTPDGEQYYFHAFCEECESESIIHVSVEPDPAYVAKLPKLGAAPRLGQISQNEILDMHNFLKKFDGNFETLFKKQP
jgi:hypothetical protein